MVDTRAGIGEHRSYVLRQRSNGGDPLQPNRHYVAVDAASWFVNQDSGWFRERMATGTLAVVLEAGSETFEVALGIYELDGGARIAPVADRAIISERVYQGGRITFKAHLSGVSRDTALGKLLRGASSASLTVAETIIQVSSPIPGASQALSAASAALVGGVRDLLNEQEEKYRLFDLSGIEKTLQPSDFIGETNYLLLHRGRELHSRALSIDRVENALTTVLYEGQPLTDGVWLLLRIRCVSEYPIARPWLSDYEQWWQKVYATIDELSIGMITPEDAIAKFAAGTEISPSLHDKYCKVRETILADSVLTLTERTAYAGMLRNLRRIASNAIKEGSYSQFFEQVNHLNSVSEGGKIIGEVELDFLREAKALNTYSKDTLQLGYHNTSVLRSDDSLIADVQSAFPEFTRLRQVIQQTWRT